MPLRPCILGFFAFVAVLFLWGTSLRAQTPTDFATWKEAKNAENVHAWAGTMLRGFRDLTGVAREELLDKNLLSLKDIIADSNVVPSTRYNAILAAGQLVSTEASPGTMPIAYPAALVYLVDVYQETDCPPYVKYGALLGIVRHALCGIDPSQQERVIDLLLETVGTEPDVNTISSAVGSWFRLTSLEGLAALKTTGAEGKVVTGLLALIHRKAQELDMLRRNQNVFNRQDWEQARRAVELASQAAKTLGDLDYRSATCVNVTEMTGTFAALTQAVCELGNKLAADTIDQKEASPDSALLLEQIVVDTKTCIQSVVWGIRGWFLTGNPGEHSLYASLSSDDPTKKQLDILLAEIVELATFLDEGDRTKRQSPATNAPKAFRFVILELRDAMAKSSEALAQIRGGNDE